MAKTLAIVASALLSHLLNWCIVGACDRVFRHVNPDLGSTAFTLGTALILSEYARFPPFLRKPSKFVLCVYYVLLSFFVSSLSARLVWMPLTDSLAELNVQTAKAILSAAKSWKLDKKGLAKRSARFLETEAALFWTSGAVGLGFLYWVSDSLKSFSDVRRFLEESPGLKKIFGNRLGVARSGILRSQALKKKTSEESSRSNGRRREDEEDNLRPTDPVYRSRGYRR